MIKLTEKSRRILRAIYRGIGAATVSLSLGACFIAYPDYGVYPEYGMPYPDYPNEVINISGKVIDKVSKNPVLGIGLWVQGTSSNYPSFVYDNGSFHVQLPKQDKHTIIFTDISGDEHGRYKTKTIELSWEEAKTYVDNLLIVEMEEETDE